MTSKESPHEISKNKRATKAAVCWLCRDVLASSMCDMFVSGRRTGVRLIEQRCTERQRIYLKRSRVVSARVKSTASLMSIARTNRPMEMLGRAVTKIPKRDVVPFTENDLVRSGFVIIKS